MNWVTKQKASDLTGLTSNQIRSKIQRGLWIRGTHYVVRDRTTFLNLQELENWICQETLPYTGASSESPSPLGKSVTVKQPIFDPLKVV